MKYGLMTERASAPMASARLDISMASLVEQAPVPTYTGTRPATFSMTNLENSIFSSAEHTKNSPLEPKVKMPSAPAAMTFSTSFSPAS